MSRIKISVVSYTNTLPFRIGMETSPEFQKFFRITYDNPAVCGKKLINNSTDIGLVPVAVLPELKNHHVLTDYCLGTNGKVDTVKLYSRVPIDQIDTIVLDYQSRTSVALVQILADKYWKIKPNWVLGTKGFESKSIKGNRGAVVIGDRTFQLNGKFKFEYDLAEVWRQFTGLPFVFALWVSNKEIDPEMVGLLNQTLKEGVERIDTIVASYGNSIPKVDDLFGYLTKRIDYKLTYDKRKAIRLYLNYLKEI